MSERWTRVEPTEVHRVGWRTVVTKHFRLPNGEVVAFDTLDKEDSHDAAVIALTPENKVIIASLFRPGPEKIMFELPGGMVDPNESPKEAALREFPEETGYGLSETSEVTELGSVPQQNAYSNATKHYFMITNVVLKGETKHEVEETIKVGKIDIRQLIDNAKGGRMTDAVAVLLAYDRLMELDKQ